MRKILCGTTCEGDCGGRLVTSSFWETMESIQGDEASGLSTSNTCLNSSGLKSGEMLSSK